MNQVNQNKRATIRGVITDIRSIPTQTGTAFVVCKVGEHKCKLFGDLAKRVLANQDEYDTLGGPEQLGGERSPGVRSAALAKFVGAHREGRIGEIRPPGQRI